MSDTTVKIAAWDWTLDPTWPVPTLADLEALVARRGLAFIHQWHREREQGVAARRHDPLRHGWEAPPFAAARALMRGTYTPGQFGPVLVPELHGVPLPPADDLLLMFGNRAGKSHFVGIFTNEVLRDIPNARARLWSQSLDLSRSIQQASVYRSLPPDLRRVKRKGQFTKVSYSGGTGFTEETLLYPQSRHDGPPYAQAWFMTYHSWANDRTIAEGFEADLIACDEEVPAELLETLRYRRGARPLQMLVTFTPLTGYTEAVGQYLEGARILETVPARRVVYDFLRGAWAWGDCVLPADKVLVEGCPPGHVPFLLQHTQVAGRYTLCASAVWNPYVRFEDVMKSAEGKALEVQLIRGFGWPTRKVRPALAFAEHHIVPPQNIPPLSELTIYLAVDPCPPPRNWFMVWVGIDREGRVWVLAEWPDASLGAWAVPGSEPDGKPGEATYEGGRGGGFDSYKLIILECEGWTPGADGVWKPGAQAVNVARRMFDPRAAAWKVPSQDQSEALTYLDHMVAPVQRQRDGKPQPIAPGLIFEAAPAEGIEKGNELINGWLTDGWNPQEPVTVMNCPRFYINRGAAMEPGASAGVHPFLRKGCGNTIWSLRTFTGRKRSGATDEKSACKDPIDCLKAIAKAGAQHQPPGGPGGRWSRGGY